MKTRIEGLQVWMLMKPVYQLLYHIPLNKALALPWEPFCIIQHFADGIRIVASR
jgi:hypothetical protein